MGKDSNGCCFRYLSYNQSFFFAKKISKEDETTIIPVIVNTPGDSSGRISQLNTAPPIGMINFHIDISETRTCFLLTTRNHSVNAAAERNESQPRAI